MRRLARIFIAVILVMLGSGLFLSVFLAGGKGFVGFPFPFLEWPRQLPPIPGSPHPVGGLHFTPAALLVDLVIWVTASLLVEGLFRGLRVLRKAR
jgi:hypothetical protein